MKLFNLKNNNLQNFRRIESLEFRRNFRHLHRNVIKNLFVEISSEFCWNLVRNVSLRISSESEIPTVFFFRRDKIDNFVRRKIRRK